MTHLAVNSSSVLAAEIAGSVPTSCLGVAMPMRGSTPAPFGTGGSTGGAVLPGGKVGVLTQPVSVSTILRWALSNLDNASCEHDGAKRILTVLNELEAIGNITLVACEQKTALEFLVFGALLVFLLRVGDFGAELNAAAEDAADLSATKRIEIGSRVGLAEVGGEGTADLAVGVEAEVLILFGDSKCGIIPDRSAVYGCACCLISTC